MTRWPATRNSGITLLEVVLALALVAIAMSLLAQLVSIGNRAAGAARDYSQAQLICESVMSEVLIGSLPMETTAETQLPSNPDWNYMVDVATTESGTMNIVTVTARRNVTSPRAVSFRLTQWQMIPLEPATDEESGEPI